MATKLSLSASWGFVPGPLNPAVPIPLSFLGDVGVENLSFLTRFGHWLKKLLVELIRGPSFDLYRFTFLHQGATCLPALLTCWVSLIAGQLNANMQHNRANGDTSTKIGVMTP